MPCGKETVVNYEHDPARVMRWLLQKLKEGAWFGFAKVDIEIRKHLWPKFEEMCTFFYSKEVPITVVPQHMLDYQRRTGRTRPDGKKLVGVLCAENRLLYARLLRLYVDHGAVITNLFRTT